MCLGFMNGMTSRYCGTCTDYSVHIYMKLHIFHEAAHIYMKLHIFA